MDQSIIADGDVAERVRTGDPAALSEIFDRHAATVTRYAWAMVDNRLDVEEVVQDTFLTLWQKPPELVSIEASVLPWLLVVCRNHSLNLRRRRQRIAGEQLPADLAAPSQEDQREAEHTLRFVRDEIAGLSPIDRRICELCLLEGRSHAEAAAELGLSVGAITKRVSRNRAYLKKAVKTDEY